MKPLQFTVISKCAALATMCSTATLTHAKCDEWIPMFDGPNGRVAAMIVYNDMLIAGGLFESCGNAGAFDDTARFIAQFNDSQWTSMAGGMSGGGSQEGSAGVRALAVYKDELIAGGYFTRAGGIPAYGIARWNGIEWLPLGAGVSGEPESDPGVLAFAEFNGELIAAGTFTTAGDVDAAFIASWNGESWAPIGNGIDSPVFALAVHKHTLVAGGENFIKYWDGESWSSFGDDLQPIGTVRALLVHNDQLIAGGQFVGPLGGTHHGILQSDGSQWIPVGVESQENSDAAAMTNIHALLSHGGDLFAAGELKSAGASIARFNGTQWMPLGAAGAGADALGIYDNALTAAGEFAVDDTTTAYIGRWYDCEESQEDPADVDNDGLVNINDLLVVLEHFGACPDTTEPCDADVVPFPGGDGVVDISDILQIIGGWN